MNSSSRLKTALLAAVSLTAASAAVATAGARTAPTEPVAIEHAVVEADHNADRASSPVSVQKIGLAALATAALAGLARLVGYGRIKRAAARTMEAAGNAASVGFAVTANAAKAVARAAASPFRSIAALAGLALIALTGVGLYDVEWAGGLVFGALIVTTALLGAGKARNALVRIRPESRR